MGNHHCGLDSLWNASGASPKSSCTPKSFQRRQFAGPSGQRTLEAQAMLAASSARLTPTGAAPAPRGRLVEPLVEVR